MRQGRVGWDMMRYDRVRRDRDAFFGAAALGVMRSYASGSGKMCLDGIGQGQVAFISLK